MPADVTVLIADDHAVVAACLSQTLSQWYRIDPPVNSLEQLRGALASWTKAAPTRRLVVVLDVNFRRVSAIRELPQLTRDFPEVIFLMFSADFMDMMVDAALAAGAMGYVDKCTGLTELRRAIDLVAVGKIAVYSGLEHPWEADETGLAPVRKVTPGLRRAVMMFRKGRSRREVAAILRITESGVDAIIARIRDTYGLPPRAPIDWMRLRLR